MIVSYMQAGLVCEYIAARWGQKGLEAVLKEYAAGKETREAIQAALKISAAQFDEDFASYVDSQLGERRRAVRALAGGATGGASGVRRQGLEAAASSADARDRAVSRLRRRGQRRTS